MTEPLKPTNYINIGGVKFNSNDIEQQQTLIKENGSIRYSVFLKNGVHLEFPKQKAENNASVYRETAYEGNPKRPETWTDVNNLAYGQIKGTSKHDTIQLFGNNGTTVDISDNDNKSDIVSIKDSVKGEWSRMEGHHKKTLLSKNNKVITSKKDYVDIKTQNSEVSIKGEGTTTEASLKGIKQEK